MSSLPVPPRGEPAAGPPGCALVSRGRGGGCPQAGCAVVAHALMIAAAAQEGRTGESSTAER